jgi:hypothetical protein
MIAWKWIKNILEAIKLPKKIIFWLFLLSSMLLFLLFKRGEWLIALYIDTIIKEYKSYLVLIFIASGTLLMIDLSIYFWEKSKTTFSKKYRIFKIKMKIRSLSSDEKAILREFFLNQKGSIRLPLMIKQLKN